MRLENPAFNYDSKGQTYSSYRQTDPRIAAYVEQALGDAATVLNVGAGAGSYEPPNRYVLAIEPSVTMRSQRRANHRPPAVIGHADALPFDDESFDAAMAMLTVHHWPDMTRGLAEVKRVTRGPIVVMTFDPDALNDFWNVQYFPQVIESERRRYPTIDFLDQTLGGHCEIVHIPIPFDCTDGFQEAFYGRPEAFLQEQVRRSQSAWGFIDSTLEAQYVEHLRQDLASGEWDRQYGHYRNAPTFTGGLRLVVSQPR